MNSEAKDPSPDSKPLLLIVDDDADLLEVLVDELSPDYHTVTAADGSAALDEMQKCFPDLVVSDIMMPVLDGVSLLREIKKNVQTAHIPFILLTARASVESQVEALGVGADDYVPKPFVMPVLEARIRNLIESRRRLLEQFKADMGSPRIDGKSEQQEETFLSRVLRSVQEHGLQENFDSEALAKCMHMSLRSFQRRLKSEAKQTPANIIRDVRMSYAARVLLSSEKSITEIGHEVGYSDSSHFSRLFRETHGMSPSDYRAKYAY
ncbi:MAG: response regulator transcription factor [Opitutales bacterium]